MLENDEVYVNGGVNLEHGDVLDSGGWAVDIDNSLVDSHLVSVPGVGSFTARRFSGGNSQDFGWNSGIERIFFPLRSIEVPISKVSRSCIKLFIILDSAKLS